MLPLGRLALGARDTRFTRDEQQTLMTLWAITRAPLIMGGDLRHLDAPTLALLTNREVLAVDQRSTDNRPHFLADGTRIWTANDPATSDTYVALFNTTGKPRDVRFPLARLGRDAVAGSRDLWLGKELGTAAGSITATLPAHGSALYRLRA